MLNYQFANSVIWLRKNVQVRYTIFGSIREACPYCLLALANVHLPLIRVQGATLIWVRILRRDRIGSELPMFNANGRSTRGILPIHWCVLHNVAMDFAILSSRLQFYRSFAKIAVSLRWTDYEVVSRTALWWWSWDTASKMLIFS